MSGVIPPFHTNGFVDNEYDHAQQGQQSHQYPIAGPSHQSLPVQHQPSFEHLTGAVNGHIPQQVYLQHGSASLQDQYTNHLPPQPSHFPPNALAGPSYSHPNFFPAQIPGPQDGYHFGAPMPPPHPQWNGNLAWEDMDGDYREGNEVIYGTLEVSPKSSSSPSTPQTPQSLNLESNRFPSVPPPSNHRGAQVCLPSPLEPLGRLLQTPLIPRLSPVMSQSNDTSFKVKHRRRTTPEQLKVLEHWFDVNPKPDNNLREWLAHELGMTKRNVQVWFQNRRAKVKGVALKEKAALAKAAQGSKSDNVRTPENNPETPPNSAPPALSDTRVTPPNDDQSQPRIQEAPPDFGITDHSGFRVPHRPPPLQIQSQPHISVQSQIGLQPPVNGINMGRRVSLANGEAAKIEMFIAKQRLAARKASIGVGHNAARQSGFVSPIRSPIIPQKQASLARRGSIPYPSPVEASALSPRISPSVRPMSSALHLAALRNTTRRTSVPGAPQVQLISSGPFTPPRVVSSHPGGSQGNNRMRELSPIKDHDGEHVQSGQQQQQQDGYMYSEADLSTTYLTPPSSTYLPNTSPNSYMHPDTSSTYDFGMDSQQPFTPNGPLPNPSFSFGSVSSVQPHMQIEDANMAMWMDMQNGGRLGSIASVNTYTTDVATAVDGSDWASEYAGLSGALDMDGFDPDARRASAPADLLHDLGILGINSNLPKKSATPLRPSPLGPNFTQGNYQSFDMTQSYSNNSGDAFLVGPGQQLDFSNPASDDSPSNSSGDSPPTGQMNGHMGLDAKQGLSLSTTNLHVPSQYDSMSGGSGSTSVSPFSSSMSTSNGYPQGQMGVWHNMENVLQGPQHGTNLGGEQGQMETMSRSSVGLEDANKEEFSFFADLNGDQVNVLA